MKYISEPPNNCSKGVLQYVQNCTNIPGNKGTENMCKTNSS